MFGEIRMQPGSRQVQAVRMGSIGSLSVPRRVLMALALMAAGLILSGAARASAATCQRVPTPNVGSRENSLFAVSATSSRNAWAVGNYLYYRKWPNGTSYKEQTLIEHWNGKAWTIQASPNPRGSHSTMLLGVAATSSTNAWAVGLYESDIWKLLIEHWNGKAWTLQPSPNLRGSHETVLVETELSGVAATSATNAWAVGHAVYRNGTSDIWKPLIEHWNGKAWTIQASPNPQFFQDQSIQLSDVAATSSTNAWAVGGAVYRNGISDIWKTLIEHWNGKAWKVQASPNPQFFQDQSILLSDVAATSATNAWAVGGAEEIPSDNPPHPFPISAHTLIEHWNGRGWTVQASPNPDEPPNPGEPPNETGSELVDVAATSSTNAWALGGPIEHWNGIAWTLQASPNLGELLGVAATSSTNAWAVGESPERRTLIEHCG
jgi:hypothetical protein